MSTFVPAQLPGVDQVLFSIRGANVNAATGAAGAQKFKRHIGPQGYVATRLKGRNASISLTTAQFQFDTVAAGNGVDIRANGLWVALTGPTVGAQEPPAATGMAARTEPDLWLVLGTAQGAPATADFDVLGYVVP